MSKFKTIAKANSLGELQSQFLWEETGWTYLIRIEQSLFNGTLTLPPDCRLIFEGGVFYNGTARLYNTEQNDVLYEVWRNVTIERYFKNSFIRPEWFGAKGDGVNDDAPAINQCLLISTRCGCEVALLPKRYGVRSSLHILSGNALVGTIDGNRDESTYRGTIIQNISSDSFPVISLNSGYNRTIDKSGCYRFHIKNLSLWGNSTANSKGIEMVFSPADSSVTNKVPRTGLLENILIRNFLTGIYMDAFSYVKFSKIEISGGSAPGATGLYIAYPQSAPAGRYREFCWFNELYINGCPKESVRIEAGNNLYFNNVDTNDSETGIKLETGELNVSAYSIFINQVNAVRCKHAFWAHAKAAPITRIQLSGLTCLPDSGRSDVISMYFTREGSNVVADSVFRDLFSGTGQQADSYFIKAAAGMSGVVFEDVRAFNKISGISNASKIGLIKMKKTGSFQIASGQTSYSYLIPTGTPGSLIDFIPVAVTSASPNIPYTARVTNQQGGDMRLLINFPTPTTEPVTINYILNL